MAKSRLLALMGKTREAGITKEKAMTLLAAANENQVNAFGYELKGENDVETAMEVFKLNVKKHPESWNVYDSMGEAYGAAGANAQSLKYYKIALSKAPDDQKDRIRKVIKS